MGEGPPLVVVAGATQYRAVDETMPKLQALLADGGFIGLPKALVITGGVGRR